MQNLNVFVSFYESNLKFSREELILFYSIVNGDFIKEDKNYLNEQLGTHFLKKQDFMNFILMKLLQLRNVQEDFDDIDLKYFMKLTNGIPSLYKKVCEYLKKEPNRFVLYLQEYYKDIILRNNYLELSKQGMLQAKCAIKNFQNITNYLNESKGEKL